MKCAKKTGRSGNERAKDELIREGEVMASLPYHENIANLQGVALDNSKSQQQQPDFLLMIEYCGNGSLHPYLKEHAARFREDLRKRKYYGGMQAFHETHGIKLLLAWSHQVGPCRAR